MTHLYRGVALVLGASTRVPATATSSLIDLHLRRRVDHAEGTAQPLMAQLPHGWSSRRPRTSAHAHDNGLLWPIPDPPMQPNLAAMPQDHGRVQVKKASKKGMQHAPNRAHVLGLVRGSVLRESPRDL